jgi:hypothetical protein
MPMPEGIIREFRWRDKSLLAWPIMMVIVGLGLGGQSLYRHFSNPEYFALWPSYWLHSAIMLFFFAAFAAFRLPFSATKWYIGLTQDEIIMSGPALFKKFRYTIRWDSIKTVDKFSDHYTRLLLKDGSKAGIWYHGLDYRQKDILRKILSERLGAPLPPGLS